MNKEEGMIVKLIGGLKKQVEKTKNKEEAQENFKHAESALGKAANKGVVKKLAAARKTSRLSAAIKKM